MSLWTSEPMRVLGYAMVTALATGLGVLPFAFVHRVAKHWLGWAGALAAGIMTAASFKLLFEGLEYSTARTVFGVVLGVLAIWLAQTRLASSTTVDVGQLHGADAKKALLIVGVMTAHSFAEGVGVGVSFGDGVEFGTFISLAIAIHNIPEGLAIGLILVPRGVSPFKAALLAIATSLPQPFIAVPSFLFVEAFHPLLPIGLGLAAGAMVWMVVSELIPDALAEAQKEHVATIAALAVAAMVAFQAIVE